MRSAISILWIVLFSIPAFGEIAVEYQSVEAFVQANSDVRIVYDFLLVGDGTQTYDRLPVTLPRENYDKSRLNAHARRESRLRIEAADDFDEREWTSIPVQPSAEKDSPNDVWLDLTGWTPQPERPVRLRLEVWMPQLVALDVVCDKTAGVLTGFTSFQDPDQSATARWRIHLPTGISLSEIVAYRELGNGKYEPLFPRINNDDETVVEWETHGQPGYYWIYTMFPANAITSKLTPDWRYIKDSEPRSLPLETVEMLVSAEEDNVTRMDIVYRAENSHSCLPMRTLTFQLPDRGSASATMNGQKLKSKRTGRRKPTYTFQFPDSGMLPGRTVQTEISVLFHQMIQRIPEEPEFVQLRFRPSVFGSVNTQPGSRWRVRILLFPDTDQRKVYSGEVPFSGTGIMQGRPYVYWDLPAIREVSVKFPRGRLSKFSGPYDFSRFSEWMAMLREVRGVQIFLVICALIILFSHRLKRRTR